MANLQEYHQILRSLRDGAWKPLYLLHGDEPYYIDRISRFIEKNALEEHERDFNQNVFYGRDLSKDILLETLKRFPMMSQYQVVIIREAQDYSGRWADLEDYFNDPMQSTILVIDYKYKKADGKTKWVKAIGKNGVVFESKKHWDNELPEVITSMVREMKYRIAPQAAHMLAEYLGNDLEKIEMELDKISITIPLSKEITTDDIHRLIGISKEYNVFEYMNALNRRDSFKSFQVAHYLGQNDKANPFLLIINNLYAHFSKVLIYHNLPSKDPGSAARSLGVRPFTINGIQEASRHYTQRELASIISTLREFDGRFKGVNSGYGDSSADLLKELTYRILN